VREADDQDALWAAINDGTICSVGSDHAPHTLEEKNLGFGAAPAGGVGIETLAPLLVDAMSRGRLTPQRLSEVLSSGTARLYGLWPRKGVIRPGADADLTIVDPAAEGVVRNDRLHALNPVSTWDGTPLRGVIVAGVLGGRLSMVDGEPVGERHGRFVPADHAATRAAEAASAGARVA
jgi:dihydroorotase